MTRTSTSNSSPPALRGVRVVELGGRIAAGVCGALLAEAGADVVLVGAAVSRSKHGIDPLGRLKSRRDIDVDSAVDLEDARQLVRNADVVVVASDVPGTGSELLRSADPGRQIVCDVTAFGSSGPMRGLRYTDIQMQAYGGTAEVTGLADGPPVAIGMPFIEVSAGLYAAAGVMAALRVRSRVSGQAVEVALYDVTINSLTTFMPLHLSGGVPRRSGNRHVMVAPWNAYAANDGWVLICSATDEHWRKLCELMAKPEVTHQPRFAKLTDRVRLASEIDVLLQDWVCIRSVQQCLRELAAVSIASGPVVPLQDLPDEPNVRHRHAARRGANGEIVPGSPLAAVSGSRTGMGPTAAAGPVLEPVSGSLSPLGGLRVVEIGQYTTAPLVARQLGMLGAQVLKIEPPEGDASRKWPPHQDGRSYFFTMSNSGKTSLKLDLKDVDDKQRFVELVRDADVLVENLKPGSLNRLGLGARDLLALNTRLIYCSISGFGHDSAYPERPAFDSVVQAMAGMMDVTRTRGTPVKAGISAADILGGQTALVAILTALAYRERSGHGQFVDLCMQDSVVWATLLARTSSSIKAPLVVSCADGDALVECAVEELPESLARVVDFREPGVVKTGENVVSILKRLDAAGIPAAKVRSVAEILADPQTIARRLIEIRTDEAGFQWPLFASPIRLSETPAATGRLIGPLGEGNDAFFGRVVGVQPGRWGTARESR